MSLPADGGGTGAADRHLRHALRHENRLLGAERSDRQDARPEAVLLAVLEHPEIPLSNNLAELGARQRVRR